MNNEYLTQLEEVKNTLEDIQILQEELEDILANPGAYLGTLIDIRDTLDEIQYLRDETEDVI